MCGEPGLWCPPQAPTPFFYFTLSVTCFTLPGGVACRCEVFSWSHCTTDFFIVKDVPKSSHCSVSESSNTTLDPLVTVCSPAPFGPLRQHECSKSRLFTSQSLLLPAVHSCQGVVNLLYPESWQSEPIGLMSPKPVFHLLSNQKIL